MAQGFATVISYYKTSFFEDWISDFKNQPYVDFNTLVEMDNDGAEIGKGTLQGYDEKLSSTGLLYLQFFNYLRSSIFITIKLIYGIVIDSYGLDALSLDKEIEEFYSCLTNRFRSLRSQSLGIGLIFDERGYSEDYIYIGKDAFDGRLDNML